MIGTLLTIAGGVTGLGLALLAMCAIDRRAARRATALFRPDHDFHLGKLLHEPGISDVDHGRWARCRAHCDRCGADRRVWRFVALDTLNVGPCPDPHEPGPDPYELREREREAGS